MADAIPYEKFDPAAPLLGTMIAVCFDVGYFYGVGIDYFTLFSLTEHIGFALEALPYALGISILAIFIDAATEAPGSWSRIRKAVKGEYDYREKGDLSSRLRRILFVAGIFLLFSGATLLYLLHLGLFRSSLLMSLFMMQVLITMAADHRWYASGPIFLFIIGCAAALLLGDFMGSHYVTEVPARYTIALKSGDPISVNVIRSGERGVLYAKYQPNVVEFAQWDSIKSISRNSERSFFDREKN
jgi:hypothetical protein